MTFKCMVCDEEFYRVEGLLKHREKEHPSLMLCKD
jgi:hypothetical protein